jgi:hypothetical protein
MGAHRRGGWIGSIRNAIAGSCAWIDVSRHGKARGAVTEHRWSSLPARGAPSEVYALGALWADREGGWNRHEGRRCVAMTSEDRLAVMAAGPTANHRVVPFYAQVQLFDPGVADAIPDWTAESLEQGVAAGPSGLAILTRDDFERGAEDLSRVRLRVWSEVVTSVIPARWSTRANLRLVAMAWSSGQWSGTTCMRWPYRWAFTGSESMQSRRALRKSLMWSWRPCGPAADASWVPSGVRTRSLVGRSRGWEARNKTTADETESARRR